MDDRAAGMLPHSAALLVSTIEVAAVRVVPHAVGMVLLSELLPSLRF
jgi:hypothetical protein